MVLVAVKIRGNVRSVFRARASMTEIKELMPDARAKNATPLDNQSDGELKSMNRKLREIEPSLLDELLKVPACILSEDDDHVMVGIRISKATLRDNMLYSCGARGCDWLMWTLLSSTGQRFGQSGASPVFPRSD
jgi:hypothetical protein